MALLVCGVVTGFVLSAVLFIRKIWSLQDEIENEKLRTRAWKEECFKMNRERVEWEEAQKGCADPLDFSKNW